MSAQSKICGRNRCIYNVFEIEVISKPPMQLCHCQEVPVYTNHVGKCGEKTLLVIRFKCEVILVELDFWSDAWRWKIISMKKSQATAIGMVGNITNPKIFLITKLQKFEECMSKKFIFWRLFYGKISDILARKFFIDLFSSSEE